MLRCFHSLVIDFLDGDYVRGVAELRQTYEAALRSFYELTKLPFPSPIPNAEYNNQDWQSHRPSCLGSAPLTASSKGAGAVIGSDREAKAAIDVEDDLERSRDGLEDKDALSYKFQDAPQYKPPPSGGPIAGGTSA